MRDRGKNLGTPDSSITDTARQGRRARTDGWVAGALKGVVRSQNKSNGGTGTNQEHLHSKSTPGRGRIH